MSTPTAHLTAEGVSIWLDDLSRSRIITGNLADLIVTRNVSGVTTNPTIFAGAIGSGSDDGSAIALAPREARRRPSMAMCAARRLMTTQQTAGRVRYTTSRPAQPRGSGFEHRGGLL